MGGGAGGGQVCKIDYVTFNLLKTDELLICEKYAIEIFSGVKVGVLIHFSFSETRSYK